MTPVYNNITPEYYRYVTPIYNNITPEYNRYVTPVYNNITPEYNRYVTPVYNTLHQQPHQSRSIQFPHHTHTSSNPSTIAAGSSNRYVHTSLF